MTSNLETSATPYRSLRLSGADATSPPVVLDQGVATPPSRLFPQFRVCRRGAAATVEFLQLTFVIRKQFKSVSVSVRN